MAIKTVLVSVLVFFVSATAFAASPWSIDNARQLAEITPSCSGGVYSNGEMQTAQMIAASLPRVGEEVADIDEKRAADVYSYAGALLKPSIVNPERALDTKSFVKCPPVPALGVKLLEFLIGGEPGRHRGPTNSYYWLGIANRRGIGVPANPIRARQYFFQARAVGLRNLTAEDWGTSPNDQLFTIARKPENFRWIEGAAAAGNLGSMVLLAELIVDHQPARARALLTALPDYIFAAQLLAKFEMEGKFGVPRPDEAVRTMAYFPRLSESSYDLMLQAARQYNGLGEEIPTSPRQVTLDELGGKQLLLAGEKAELDSIRGVVRARALSIQPEPYYTPRYPIPRFRVFRCHLPH